MSKYPALVGAACVLGALCLAFVHSGVRAEEPVTDAFVMQTCTSCHSASRICRNLGRDADWWQRTVKHMQRKGASISDEQVYTVGAFMAAKPQGASPVCD